MAQVRWKKYTLQFKRPSGTSRGVLTTKVSYFLIWEYDSFAYPALGECSLIEGLSPDPKEGYEHTLDLVCQNLREGGNSFPDLSAYPSIQFGLETLLLDIQAKGSKQLFNNAFSKGSKGMQINGLIWMGERAFMREQIVEKIHQGFACVKLKIGATDFETELSLLRFIREEFGSDIELRVDANGAFAPDEASGKLRKLAAYDLHSIEQPIAQGQWEDMAQLCEQTPLPIALDEELIGISEFDEKKRLMETIKPQYIILKPSLHGGMKGSDEWIRLAEEQGAKWWITSALESNVGLNAIAQYTFEKDVQLPQGLGTGGLYTNNFDSPLYLQGQIIRFDPNKNWDLTAII
ncbi:MAG: o-succinylbenzoate synthase [Flavobacteriales bacterium]|nr:o-succinylbenzoate synthase [Flavobacteriales bacterium]